MTLETLFADIPSIPFHDVDKMRREDKDAIINYYKFNYQFIGHSGWLVEDNSVHMTDNKHIYKTFSKNDLFYLWVWREDNTLAFLNFKLCPDVPNGEYEYLPVIRVDEDYTDDYRHIKKEDDHFLIYPQKTYGNKEKLIKIIKDARVDKNRRWLSQYELNRYTLGDEEAKKIEEERESNSNVIFFPIALLALIIPQTEGEVLGLIWCIFLTIILSLFYGGWIGIILVWGIYILKKAR